MTDAELRRARDPLVANREASLASNATWQAYLSDLQQPGVPKSLGDIRAVHDHFGSVSLAEVNQACRCGPASALRPQARVAPCFPHVPLTHGAYSLCIRPGPVWAVAGVTTNSSDVTAAESAGKSGGGGAGAAKPQGGAKKPKR